MTLTLSFLKKGLSGHRFDNGTAMLYAQLSGDPSLFFFNKGMKTLSTHWEMMVSGDHVDKCGIVASVVKVFE